MAKGIEGKTGIKLVKHLDTIFNELERLREKEDRRRRKLKQYFDDGTDDPNVTGTINYIKTTILQTTGRLTDNRPAFQISDINNAQTGTADDMDLVFKNYIYPRRYFEAKVATCLQPSQKYGTGWFEVYQDYEDMDELGATNFRVNLNSDMYPGNPKLNAYDIDRNDVFCYAPWVSVDEAKRMFPDKAHLIKEDDKYMEDPDGARSVVTEPAHRSGTAGSYTYESDSRLFDQSRNPDILEPSMTRIQYFYIRDDTTRELDTVDELGFPITETVPKYPFWRLICKQGEVILSDKTWDRAWLPFTPLPNYLEEFSTYGISDIELEFEQQKRINKRADQLDALLDRAAHPPFIVDKGSGISKKKFLKWGKKLPLLIEKVPGREARYDQGPAIPSALFEHQFMQENQFDKLSGERDVSRGGVPPGVTAGSAIGQLQEAAQVRVRYKARNLEWALMRLGQQMTELVADEWSEYKRLVVPEGSGRKTVEFNKNVQTENGIERQNTLENISWQVMVKKDSLLGQSKEARTQQAVGLLQVGALDAEAVLEASEYPNWEKHVARLNQKQQQAAQAQQQQAQAESQQKQAELQIKSQENQIKMQEIQIKAQESQAKLALQAQESQAKIAQQEKDNDFERDDKRQRRINELIVNLLKTNENMSVETATNEALRIEALNVADTFDSVI